MKLLKFKILFLLFFQFSFVNSDEFALISTKYFSNLLVKTAIDQKSMIKGLMGLNELKGFNGMLFIYKFPKKVNFWMHNTIIPLDLIFIDENMIVSSIKHGIPLKKDIISSDKNILAVLEIPFGCSQKLKLKKGEKLNWLIKSYTQIKNIRYFHCLN